ncbi:chemokine-like protein TAFA-5 [Acipenser oxyrinchus oxyrinchus]|uniref:Chemokine-like protein TAFA-5 n=2 Tax=Acipenser TaxID=7901 RepID=A0AAD8FUY2_ACIOX|nr:chemokine-like protein TAFA-5 [Acipenser oxyrinchus oxyrinchus]KAK1152852.1 chemokine-like protein TAFA-5 [Acipenser oxyrinchus oxyrinchus]
MQAGLRALFAGTGASLCCLFLLWVIYSHLLKEGQLAVGTCEIVTLNRDSSQPRRMIARQTARCACRRGQIAGTTRARPACVDARIVKNKQWCEMAPCSEGEICGLLLNRSGWTCTKGGGRIKTVTVSFLQCSFTFVV